MLKKKLLGTVQKGTYHNFLPDQEPQKSLTYPVRKFRGEGILQMGVGTQKYSGTLMRLKVEE